MAINVKDKLVTLESLGVAYSAEQDAREEADQALSTRIDNIVAPDGDPSLTEVSDARVSGSTTHNTLKARLDADQAAVGTEISAIKADLGYRCNLLRGEGVTSGADLNDYTTPGTYYVGSASAASNIVNTPVTDAGFKLIVANTTSSSRIRQYVIPNSNTAPYVRYYNGETWSSWERYAYSSVVNGFYNLARGVAVPLESNLNDYTTAGVFFVGSAASAATIVNTPITSTSYKLVVEETISSARIKQTVVVNSANSNYVRWYNGTTWSAWERYAYQSYVEETASTIYENINRSIQPKWELGNIGTNTPWNTEATNRIRTALNEIAVGNGTTITFDKTKIKVSIRLYDKGGKFLATSSSTYFDVYDYSTAWKTSGKITIPNDATLGYYRLCAAYSNDADITDINDVIDSISIVRQGYTKEYGVIIDSIPLNIDTSIERATPLYATVCAVKEKHSTNKIDRTVGYLLRENVEPFRFYFASGNLQNARYLFTWNKTIANNLEPISYCFAVSEEGDVIAVFRGELNGNSSSTGDIRSDPIVYPHGDFSNPVKVNITGMDKPTSWLMNTGVYCEHGCMFFVEYTRPRHTTANLWKVSAPYTSPSNWSIKKTYVANTDIEHWHHVTKDPFSGIMYASTGDEDAESMILYSTDDGDTWTVLRSGDQKVCRQLNFIFTEKYIYSATDSLSSSSDRVFIRTTRDANGLMKTADADVDVLYTFNYPGFATYHICYFEKPNGILLLERSDTKSSAYLGTFYFWDIAANKMRYAGSFEPNGNVYLGFRCEAVSHYPEIVDNKIVCGFSLFPNCIKYKGNPDISTYLGDRGIITNDAYNNDVFNNLVLSIVPVDKYLYNDNQ